MTQPAQPAAPAHIPGLITAAGIAPSYVPGQPVPAAQPGTTVPAPGAPSAPPAQAAPVPVTQAVQAQPPQEPAAPAVLAGTPAPPAAPLLTAAQWAAIAGSVPPQHPTSVNVPQAAAGVPGLNTATVPGLNAPVPAPPAPAPAPPAPAPAPATGAEAPADRGYPEGTPLEQMSSDQREAYWKFHSRQWEARAKERNDYDSVKAKAEQYDQYVASQATETEKQIAAARADGERTATARAAVVLVDAHVRAGLQQRLQPHQVEALASNLNYQHFLGTDGLTVDAAKVATFVDTVAPIAAPAAMAPAVPAVPGALPTGVPPTYQQPQQPATGLPRQLPDLGQGAQTQAPLDKLEAGRQQARAFLANGGNR